MNNLLGRQVDSNYVVRMYCIRGLGNMADIGENKVKKTAKKQRAIITNTPHLILGFSVFNHYFECHVSWYG